MSEEVRPDEEEVTRQAADQWAEEQYLDGLDEVLKLRDEYEELRRTNAMDFYEPYPYQLTFHEALDDAGQRARQRCLMAGNKVGKTFSGAMELAYHLTGKYPDWWTGHRFDRAINAWAAGKSHYATRDIVQSELIGEPGDPESFGTGAIPKDLIVKTERNPGVPNALGFVLVKHVSGRNSRLQFKSYDAGPTAWMGVAVDYVWLDEEPPQEIYSQALRATLKSGGPVSLTFTPEAGVTGVVAMFMNERKGGQALVQATWDDAPHLSIEVREEILAALPPHERLMRSKGIPTLGSGQVFPVPEDQIQCGAFPIPEHFSRIAGIDFGFDHPTAVVWLAHDRDTDVVYLYDAYREKGSGMLQHAEAIKHRGGFIPVAWPHDGSIHDKGSGEALATQYRRAGVNFLGSHFTNPEGGIAVEPGLMALLTRMQTGRFKVFNHLDQWFQEFRMYHRKDGKVVRKSDDLMSATRYACQSLRYATTANLQPRPSVAVGSLSDGTFDPFQFWMKHPTAESYGPLN